MDNRTISQLSKGGTVPAASTSQAGIVQLNSDGTAADNATAATPGMVRDAIIKRINTDRQLVTIKEHGMASFTTPNNGNCVILSVCSANSEYGVFWTYPTNLRVYPVGLNVPQATGKSFEIVITYLKTD